LPAGDGQVEYVTFTPTDSTDYATVYAVVVVNVSQNTTTTTVSSSPNPLFVGQSATLTATVTPGSGIAVPTGSVQFQINGSDYGAP
jgi:hypothetical protein